LIGLLCLFWGLLGLGFSVVFHFNLIILEFLLLSCSLLGLGDGLWGVGELLLRLWS